MNNFTFSYFIKLIALTGSAFLVATSNFVFPKGNISLMPPVAERFFSHEVSDKLILTGDHLGKLSAGNYMSCFLQNDDNIKVDGSTKPVFEDNSGESIGADESLIATIVPCRAVVAFNLETGMRKLVHFLPTIYHCLEGKETNISKETINLIKTDNFHKLLSDITGKHWRIAIVEVGEVMPGDLSVSSAEIYQYLISANRIDPLNIIPTNSISERLRAEFSCPTVINSQGVVTVYFWPGAYTHFKDTGIRLPDSCSFIDLRLCNPSDLFLYDRTSPSELDSLDNRNLLESK